MASGLPEKIRSRLVLEVGLIINTSSSIMSCKDSFIAIKIGQIQFDLKWLIEIAFFHI
jgi:hypothetical protein